jgi:hypothetical protein
MKKGIVAACVVMAGVGGFWAYSHNAKAQETTADSAANALLGKHAKEGKGEKGDKKSGGPMFEAAESVSGLTADQKTHLGEIKAQFQTKMKDLRKNSGKAGATEADKKDARKEMKPQLQALNQETKNSILVLLNDDQKKEFETKLQGAMQAAKSARVTSGTAEKKE